MEDKGFVWTPELSDKLFTLRFENDWLFKENKQPWRQFYKILLENGFPNEMTVNHVRKKWSYTYDMYKIAKKTKNKDWKYYKIFNKHFGKAKILDKYESWSDDWRLKLVTCIKEAKERKLEFHTMWRTVEAAIRFQNLPIDCCVQDIKGLWQHLKTTFNRKHRLKMKKGVENIEWPLYRPLLNYFQKFDPNYIINLETNSAYDFIVKQKSVIKYSKSKRDDNDNESDEFVWSKDITETFIQIRLQNDWIFREKKWAWNELRNIMVEEYSFPRTLTGREINRKWAAIFSEYQKAKATNNYSWVYYTLFELYLGEGSLSLNPLVGWREEWVFNFIGARTDLEHLFKYGLKDQTGAWREIEKRLRRIDLPLDHSLLDLPLIWTHLLKAFKWKRKFASKGILNEQWPYYEAMTRYMEVYEKQSIMKQEESLTKDFANIGHDDDYEDDMKLFDLKQKLQIQPKSEPSELNQCRACACGNACVNIFLQSDDEGINIAHKLKVIGGIELGKSDNLPTQICYNCLQELENAYKFRRKCLNADKQLRDAAYNIKCEAPDKLEDVDHPDNSQHEFESNQPDHIEMDCDIALDIEKPDTAPRILKKEQISKRRRKRKLKYDYRKICEVCGKHTKNLISHLDMHSTSKTYSCDVCDKRFKFKSGLIIHKAVHEPTPRKTCEVCGKTFHIVAQYRRHYVYHANERRFACDTCGKRFNTPDILRVHARTHTDERPFRCALCGKTFRTAGCVSRHRRIVHKHTHTQ